MSGKNTFVKLIVNGFSLLAGDLWSFTGDSRSFVHSYLHRRSYWNGCKMFTKNKYIYVYIYTYTNIYKYLQIYTCIYAYVYIYPFTYVYHIYTYVNTWYIYVNGYINIYYIYIYIICIYTYLMDICTSIYIFVSIYLYILECSSDISCCLFVNPSHTDESWAGRTRVCGYIYMYIYYTYIYIYIICRSKNYKFVT